MDLTAPLITIVDPHAVAMPNDFQESGRELSWRPRRGTSVALILIVGAAWLGLSRYLDERADTAAIQEVQLAVTHAHVLGGAELTPRETLVGLVSRGRHPVTLIALNVSGAGQDAGGVRLSRDRAATVALPAGPSCARAALTRLPDALHVTLRTYRGSTLSRTLPLSPVDAMRYVETERTRCGYPPPQDALGLQIASSAVVGRSIVVTYLLWSGSRDPLDITRVATGAGISVTSTRIPVHVPLSAHSPPGASVTTLALRFRISSCRDFAAAQRAASSELPFVALTVRDAFSSGIAQTSLGTEDDGYLATKVDPTAQFRTWCGLR